MTDPDSPDQGPKPPFEPNPKKGWYSPPSGPPRKLDEGNTQPPELKDQQRRILRDQFIGWNAFAKKGESENSPGGEAFFILDRRTDPESVVTHDIVKVYGYKKGEEKMIFALKQLEGSLLGSNTLIDGEDWVMVAANPKDRYRPALADNSGVPKMLLTQQLEVFLSSEGRAFQRENAIGIWLPYETVSPDDVPPWTDRFFVSCLKDFPAGVSKDSTNFTTPLQPLHGQNLERLRSLLEDANRGNFLEYAKSPITT